MMHRQLLSGCIYTLLLFFGFTLNAQLPEKLPTLVINEVHIESLEDNNYFIEFVVTETNRIPYDKNHDSPSLIVDDSNTSSSAQAGFLTIEPNALRTVKRGDLVVVHGNGANTSMAGTDVVLLDFDSDLIGKWQGAPNPITGTYEDATKVIVGDHLITDYISFTGSGNILGS